jgi:uroporphyrinogen-III synthase
MSDINYSKIIVITRAQEESEIIAKTLVKKGLTPLIEPLFGIEKITPDKQKFNFGNLQALIITSANAGTAIIELNLDKNIKIFAVGEKTANQLKINGYKNIFYPQEKSAFSLKKLLLSKLDLKKGKIVYFCGQIITLDFEIELKKEGFEVEKILAYKTIEVANFSNIFLKKLLAKEIGQILIYSKNTGHIFLNLLKKVARNNNLSSANMNQITLRCFSKNILLECINLQKDLGLDFVAVENFIEVI